MNVVRGENGCRASRFLISIGIYSADRRHRRHRRRRPNGKFPAGRGIE